MYKRLEQNQQHTICYGVIYTIKCVSCWHCMPCQRSTNASDYNTYKHCLHTLVYCIYSAYMRPSHAAFKPLTDQVDDTDRLSAVPHLRPSHRQSCSQSSPKSWKCHPDPKTPTYASDLRHSSGYKVRPGVFSQKTFKPDLNSMPEQTSLDAKTSPWATDSFRPLASAISFFWSRTKARDHRVRILNVDGTVWYEATVVSS